MSTLTIQLPVVRPEGWDVPDGFAVIDGLGGLRTTVASNDDEVERLRGLADGIERDNAYGVAVLGLSIHTAYANGTTAPDIAVALGYAPGDRSGEMFVSRYRVIGEAVSHGCDTDAVLAVRTLVREGVKTARNVVKASLTDDGVNNAKLARAMAKAGKPVKPATPADEQLTKRLTAAHNALAKVAETLAEGQTLTDANREQVTNIVTLINAIAS